MEDMKKRHGWQEKEHGTSIDIDQVSTAASEGDEEQDYAVNLAIQLTSICTVPVVWLIVDPEGTCAGLFKQEFVLQRSLAGVQLKHATKEALRHLLAQPHDMKQAGEVQSLTSELDASSNRASTNPVRMWRRQDCDGPGMGLDCLKP